MYGADTNWKQTSYNTKGNQYWEYVDVDGQEFQDHVVASDQSKKFRGATNTKEWLEIIDYVYNKYNKKNSNKNLDFDEM